MGYKALYSVERVSKGDIMEEFKTPITFIDVRGNEIKTEVPYKLKEYINILEKDVESTFSLYGLISYSLYGDIDSWRDLGMNLFREEILRHFYDEKDIGDKINGKT